MASWCHALVILLLHLSTSSAQSESQILLKFKQSLNDHEALSSWNTSTPPCSKRAAYWVGVLCHNWTVWGLRLESMGLTGVIDVGSLKELPNLRTLSFRSNNLHGPMPSIRDLGKLRSVFLSYNKFSGDIPADAFEEMVSLRKVHLAENEFTGQIPLSLTILPKLVELRLEGNHFEGEIPDFQLNALDLLNVSNNALEGQIPASLATMNATSFSGNRDLCGGPLGACCSKLSVLVIVIVVLVLVAAVTAIAAVFIILRQRKTSQRQKAPATPGKVVSSDALDKIEQGSPENSFDTDMVLLRDDGDRFNLQDLLKASAEILGSGCFGSSYKATLRSGPVVVVKRSKQMNNVNREEFQEHMRMLGRLRHPNLLPLLAFCYRKEEKLLVSDHVNNVSLAVHLHGKQSDGEPGLDWPTRLKIVRGIARGLLFLYNELSGLIVSHGHLKSSNVLLSSSFEPLLADYGLIPVVNQEHAQDLMVAYKSPEYKQHRRITKKTDVWSLGVLILEILTGHFPTNYLQQGRGSETDLATWVQSVVREEWTVEVFDRGIAGAKSCEVEMVKLLKIGLACCEADVEKRWDLKEAVERIEEVRDKDIEEDFYSSYASEGDVWSSRGLSDDFSFSVNVE